MWSDLTQEFHHGFCARELDLAYCHGGGGEEFAGFALEGVQCVETEEFVQEGDGVGVEGGSSRFGGERFVEVLDDEILRVCGAEAPEIDEEAVPGVFVFVTVPQGFEGEESGTPGESGDDVGVGAEDVEGGAHVLAGQEGAEDSGCVVVWGVAFQD